MLKQRYPNTPLTAVGFSQGANMLLKYLGERRDHSGFKLCGGDFATFSLRSIAIVFAMASHVFINGIYYVISVHFINKNFNIDRLLLLLKLLIAIEAFGI